MRVTLHQKVSFTMRAIHGPAMGGAWLLTAALAAMACHPGAPRPRSEGLARQLREIALTAERDSLVMEVAANGKLLGDIQAELSKVIPTPGPGKPESPALEVTTDQREFTLQKVREITGRLQAAETKVAESERRARRLAQTADSLTADNTAAKSTIADLVTILGTQRESIANLTAQVGTLTAQNLTLADSVFHLTDDRNTVYYVVGTRSELLARGVIVEDGHRSFPLIGRRAVQPARTLPRVEFTSVNRRETRQIPLPRGDRSYAIVSRQNLTHLASRVGPKGQVKGVIEIASPEEFWEPSKYLIVVER
jgi:hypothetical protein